jgi:molybdopterin-synthase adenylyltransferase
MRTFYGVAAEAFPVCLTGDNIATVAAGADLLVDCLDNIAGRTVVLKHAIRSGIPSVHSGLAGDASVGLVRWGERFRPDPEDEPGRATCEAGEHLPFIGLLGATLAGIVTDFVRTGERRDALLPNPSATLV